MAKDHNLCVLLSGWGGFGGTGIIDSLRHNTGKHRIRIVSADKISKPALNYKADAFHTLPRGDSAEYLKQLIALCKHEAVDVVLPGSTPEIITLSKNLDYVKDNNVAVALDSYDKISPLLDKGVAYEFLRTGNIAVPKFVRVKNSRDLTSAVKLIGYPKYPVCIKPASYADSGGARGFKILRRSNTPYTTLLGEHDEIDYSALVQLSQQSKRLNLLAMEYLPGTEFSVYVLSKKGRMLYCIPNKRERLINHYSVGASTVTVHDPVYKKIAKICEKTVRLFGLNYNTNIQIKISRTGSLKIVEINPRMGGSIVLPVAAGINLPYLSVLQALGENLPPVSDHTRIGMTRYFAETFQSDTKSFDLA